MAQLVSWDFSLENTSVGSLVCQINIMYTMDTCKNPVSVSAQETILRCILEAKGLVWHWIRVLHVQNTICRAEAYEALHSASPASRSLNIAVNAVGLGSVQGLLVCAGKGWALRLPVRNPTLFLLMVGIELIRFGQYEVYPLFPHCLCCKT